MFNRSGITAAIISSSLLSVTGLGTANAASVPTVLGSPAGAAVQSVGGAVTAAGRGHAGIAPTVYSAAPAAEPMADGVTNGLLTVGGGIRTTGQSIQTNGLQARPGAGAQTAVQTVRNGSLAQAQVGGARVGSGSSSPLIGAGALTSAPPQGSLATAGVTNTSALLNATVAPQ